jgi:Ca2+-transporting ATPase
MTTDREIVPSAVGAPAWHALAGDAALRHLSSSANGLPPAAAARRLAQMGPNALPDLHQRTQLEILFAQLTNLPSALLFGSSALSTLVGDRFDAGAILAAIGLNAGIGYSIERKNEILMASWRQLEAGQAQVLRGGALCTVPASELVPGDLILCRAGDIVPADARVLETHRLSCDESALTGESEPQRKRTEPAAAGAVLAQRSSMLYAGTTVATGHCRALVVATGAATEAAQVRGLLEGAATPRTPLQRQLDRLGRVLAVASVGAGVFTALAGFLHGRPPLRVLRNGVALAVAAIPEGLPMVSVAALVRSMQRMRSRGMVVRRVASAETLGGVSVVCADKTGTLTRNDMRLELLDLGDGPIDPDTVRGQPQRLFQHRPTLALAAGVLNSDVDVQRAGRATAIAGSSTERALVRAAERSGLDRAALREAYPRRVLRERDDVVHYVTSVHDVPGGGAVAFVKGAPEQVLRLCSRDGRGRPLTPAARRSFLARNDQLAGEGLRVLALGWRRLPAPSAQHRVQVDRGYTLIGLAGLRDPLREGAAEAIRNAARAGVRTVIVTGDQRRTAEAVARSLGLEGETLDGRDVARLLASNGSGARERLRRAAVFSRVAPADKVAIVHALRASGEIVAMAGDGINDAPALQAADIGIAIGIHSSDLARQAADVVLENEDLRTILSAIGEGRIVQDNLRRALRYLLATNFAEVAVVGGAALLGLPDPFTPLQLLWINLLSDTLPALALALEPAQDDVLARPPARPDVPLLGGDAGSVVARDGLVLAGLGAGALLVGGPPLLFSLLGGAELGYAAVCRAPGAPPDRQFLRLLGGGALLHLAALTLPPLRGLLGLRGTVSALELAGFATGLALPVGVAGFGRDEVIIRTGNAHADAVRSRRRREQVIAAAPPVRRGPGPLARRARAATGR